MGKVVDYLEKYYKDTNYNCAEAVFSAAAEAWGLDISDDVIRTMGCFGGGMGCAIVCGAVTGGSAALSYKFVEGDGGHTSPEMMVPRIVRIFGHSSTAKKRDAFRRSQRSRQYWMKYTKWRNRNDS